MLLFLLLLLLLLLHLSRLFAREDVHRYGRSEILTPRHARFRAIQDQILELIDAKTRQRSRELFALVIHYGVHSRTL